MPRESEEKFCKAGKDWENSGLKWDLKERLNVENSGGQKG